MSGPFGREGRPWHAPHLGEAKGAWWKLGVLIVCCGAVVVGTYFFGLWVTTWTP